MKIDKLKKDDIVELNIDAYTSEGQGIGRHNGMAVFVPFALKGERIRARIVKTTSSYAIGRLTDVISRSDDRIDPVCKVFGRCGGCNLLHMSYSEQLEFKRQQVQNALERIGGFRGVFVEPCIGMDKHEGYRNKASFPFAYDGGKVVSGYFESKSHRLIPISECRIQNEILIQAKRIVTDWANKFSISVYDERSRKGILRHVVVRETNDGVMVVIVTTGRLPRANELVTMLKEGIPKLKSIIHNTNTSDTSLILGRKSSVIFGYRSIIETLGELKFSVSAESFLQVNRTQTLKLYETAINGLKLSSNDVVIDLYCGIGTISLLMAGRVKFVLGIESVQAAIDNAKENAELNNISNVKFICREVETLLPKLIDGEGAKTDNGIEFLAFVAKYGTLKEGNGVSICTNLKNEYCNENILEGFSARRYNIDHTKHLEAKEIPYRNEEKAWVKRKHPIDALVLDPPRKGAEKPALDAIIKIGIPKLAYVSCNPATLARDCKILCEGGYEIVSVQPVDMFSETHHVETVILLSKGEVDSKKIRVEFSLEDMDMSEVQDGATYSQIKEYVLEHTGLKVSSLYISQVKRKCGLEVDKNCNLLKLEDSRQPQCPPEKEKAIREAMKYFGMI